MRVAGGPAWGLLQGHFFGIPVAGQSHQDDGGLWEGSEGISPSLSTHSCVYSLTFGRYFSERGDAVAKASKETHVVST